MKQCELLFGDESHLFELAGLVPFEELIVHILSYDKYVFYDAQDRVDKSVRVVTTLLRSLADDVFNDDWIVSLENELCACLHLIKRHCQ